MVPCPCTCSFGWEPIASPYEPLIALPSFQERIILIAFLQSGRRVVSVASMGQKATVLRDWSTMNRGPTCNLGCQWTPHKPCKYETKIYLSRLAWVMIAMGLTQKVYCNKVGQTLLCSVSVVESRSWRPFESPPRYTSPRLRPASPAPLSLRTKRCGPWITGNVLSDVRLKNVGKHVQCLRFNK